jgi:hypothetical protein
VNRRTYLGALAAGAAGTLAGCSALVGAEPDRTSGERRLQYDEDSVGSRARDPEAVAPYIQSMARTYDGMGIYGESGGEPDQDLPIGGLWTQPLEHGSGVVSNHALLLYRLPSAPDGTPSAALWLWSAADPSIAEGATVERIETHVDLPGDGAEMGIYNPGGDRRSEQVDAYTVGTARKDVSGPSVSMPLPAGRVEHDPELTQVGDAGGYAPLWRGSHDGAVGLLATCEIRWPASTDQHLTWSMAAETTGT